MRRSALRGLTAIFMAAVLAACSCSEDIVCSTVLQVSGPSLVAFAGTDSFTAVLCMEGYCDTVGVTPDSSTPDPSLVIGFDLEEYLGDTPRTISEGPVTLTIATSDGTTFTATGRDIEFETTQPKGRLCDMTCYSAQLQVVNGELVDIETVNE